MDNLIENFNKTGNQNVFEEVIDLMMVDELSEKHGFDDKFKSELKNLPTEQKRMVILGMLEKASSRPLFMKIRGLTDKNINRMDHIKDVILMLRDYVKVGEVEKKKFGEVMTPLELVKEMLQTLPDDVWSNPNLKWLDPANGTGPFPVMVIYKLMEGLKEWEPDDNKRYKHIIENMIYVSELQPKNMFLWLCVADPFDEYLTNIYTGSFLDDGFDKHMKEVWGVEKFDIVMGNPPYQWKRENETKSHPLWHLFVEKSIEKLKIGGYLTMVHPSGWRNIDGKFKNTQNIILSKHLLSLNMNTFKDGLEVFGAKIDFDYYCLINNESNNLKMTKICDIDNEIYDINLCNVNFIPSANIRKIYSLIAKDNEEKVTILSDSSYHTQRKELMNKEKIDGFEYPCIYMVKYGLNVVCWYSNVNDKGHFNIPKVIWGNGSSDVMIDENGDYGLTQFAYAIVDDIENLSNIKKALDSDDFINNIMCYRFGLGHKYNRKIIATFRRDFWKEFI